MLKIITKTQLKIQYQDFLQTLIEKHINMINSILN